MKQASLLYLISFIALIILGCSKDEEMPKILDYDTAIIESITVNELADYDLWDAPGKPDLFYELILEPSTFVTTSMLIADADLPAIWDQEIILPGEKEATFFLRFTDQDNGSIDEQIFAVNLRPSLAYPVTDLVFEKDGNQLEIKLRYE